MARASPSRGRRTPTASRTSSGCAAAHVPQRRPPLRGGRWSSATGATEARDDRDGRRPGCAHALPDPARARVPGEGGPAATRL